MFFMNDSEARWCNGQHNGKTPVLSRKCPSKMEPDKVVCDKQNLWDSVPEDPPLKIGN